jgi:ADP-L-glycero-D-manno-heptose 6-epimerase
VVGLRYFNVFGPGEAHKNNMASVVYHFDNQINEMGELKLFKGSHGYDDGEQRRDFIFVDDVIKVNLWMMNNSNISGIYNVGTGKSHSFNDIANAVIKSRKTGRIKYIPFPKELEESYQSYTEANLENLRSVGYEKEFIALDEGVSTYLDAIY